MSEQITEDVAIGRLIEVREREMAQERQAEGQRLGGQIRQGSMGANCPQADKGRARERVGRAVGMSGRTYQDAKAVVLALTISCSLREAALTRGLDISWLAAVEREVGPEQLEAYLRAKLTGCVIACRRAPSGEWECRERRARV